MTSYGVSNGTLHHRVETPAGLPSLTRARSIFAIIRQIIADTPGDTMVFVVEGAAFGMASASAQVDAGYLMAHFDLLAEEYGATVYVVPPSTLKKFVTGKGNTPKAEMALRVFKKWKIEFDRDPGCDKLMAYCLHRYGVALLAGEIEHAAPKPRGQGRHAKARIRKTARTMAGVG
jgi:Holliday junction resolvasome RuvABC endonuclease subunit